MVVFGRGMPAQMRRDAAMRMNACVCGKARYTSAPASQQTACLSIDGVERSVFSVAAEKGFEAVVASPDGMFTSIGNIRQKMRLQVRAPFNMHANTALASWAAPPGNEVERMCTRVYAGRQKLHHCTCTEPPCMFLISGTWPDHMR